MMEEGVLVIYEWRPVMNLGERFLQHYYVGHLQSK
jgi:hypothetical protein